MITVDTLRADHLGCYGYGPYKDPVSPAIDQLAAQGLRLSNYFAPRAQTAPSLCSMMVGHFPSSHGVRDNGMAFAPGMTTLAEHLKSAGYRTAAFVSRMPATKDGHPARGVELLEDGVRDVDGRPTADFHLADEVVTAKALDWLGQRGPDEERPFFAWLHLFGLHKPYSPPAPYDRLFVQAGDGPLQLLTQRSSEPWQSLVQALDRATLSGEPPCETDRRFVLATYDGALRAVDERVGRLLARLDQRALADQTLVAFTSDHGEELGDHNGYWYHGNSVYDSALKIPLILRWPGVLAPDTVWEGLAQNVDFAPTLLDWLGLPGSGTMEGVSLAPWLGTDRPPTQPPRTFGFVEWQDVVFGVRTLESKLLLNPRGAWLRKTPYDRIPGTGYPVACAELYDLSGDAGEQRNRAGEDPTREKSLRERALAHRNRPAWIRAWKGAAAGSDASLESLGYVGASEERHDVLFDAQECPGESR